MSEVHQKHWHREALGLAEAIVNDEATAEQVERLDAILAVDESARTLYLDYIDVHAGLRRRYLSPGFDESAPLPVESIDRSAQRRSTLSKTAVWLPSVLALAASVAIVGVGQVWPGEGESPASAPTATQTASVNGVAVLSRMVDVEWSDGALAYGEGSPVPAGLISIESGVLQVDFYSGAIAVLEGPAKLELVSADEAALRDGKLRARVPKRARGFSIATATGKIVDLGTEFAIEAPQADAPGELHVIDGEVHYHSATSDLLEPVSLRSGDAVWLGEESGESPPSEGERRFIGPTEVETLARRDSTNRQKIWSAHRGELLKDPDLLALYGYSPAPEWSRLFRNHAAQAEDDTHGAVVGAEWVEGRWPGHKALSFRNASHRVSISLSGWHESLTLASWIAVDRFHSTNRVALMHPELSQEHALFWTLDRVPTGAVLHFAETAEPTYLPDRNHFSSKRHGMVNEDLGSWVHLAVVYDPDTRRVTHYRNGDVVGWAPIDEPRRLMIGEADLGNWPYRDWAEGTEFEMRNLMGRMDEFVAVGRAMSGDEIAQMHDAGAP